jgi:hypothetical protein
LWKCRSSFARALRNSRPYTYIDIHFDGTCRGEATVIAATRDARCGARFPKFRFFSLFARCGASPRPSRLIRHGKCEIENTYAGHSVGQDLFIEEQKMLSRIATCTMVAAAVALFTVSGVAQATGVAKPAKPAKAAKAAVTSHSGKIVSVTEGKDGKDGKFVMSDADGKNEHTHAVLATTKITLNKKAGKLADLKKGDMVTVTLDSASKVTEIAATRDAK